ncbi:MAG: hypothetical protein H7346_26250 [Burkholderiaceae bacterium]|nr:hypothetical protein [Burkholderiaceae bacterium]
MRRDVFAELTEGFDALAGERMVELQTELQAYRDGLAHMLSQHDGEYVVIKGSRPAHFSATYEAALDWAYDQFGLQRFLVKKVSENEAVAHTDVLMNR